MLDYTTTKLTPEAVAPSFLDRSLTAKATSPFRAVKFRCLYCPGTHLSSGTSLEPTTHAVDRV